MSSEFRKVKLKDIASFKYGKTIRKQDIQSCGEYPVFSGYQVVGYLPSYMYKEEQLIIVCRGAGGTGDIKMSPGFCSITNLAIIISCDDKIIDKGYLYWRLILSDTYSLRTGSAQPQITINTLESFEIDIEPNLRKQREIARILFNINNKIRNNVDINQTLEQMAQALFKSWFVDFEPVKAKMAVLEAGGSQEDATLAAMTAISGKDEDALAVFEREHPEQYAELKTTAELFPSAMQDSELGEIPVGWLVKPLGDSLEIKRGGSPRPIKDFIRPTGYPWVKIADATASTSPFLFKTSEFIKEEGLKKTVYLRKGDLILSNSATPGLPKFLQLDACIHDGWLYFPKISNYTDTYLYFLFLKIRRELVAKGNGSVFTNLKTDILREHLAVLPEYKIVNRFSVLALSYLDAIKANELTINSLSCLRDTLLPKLLSGEITLPEVEQAVSEAENV
ncbi:restriction endonuclease subunit S [Citrobacter portucalensis]|uniref:Restriction endonuclease subunit S n=1 Tax=Citrobacter portucalensis TaxID=1639133 RepID=A0AAW5W519_9ENTR|nr:restriction endonuclease subunit S [Citrobacter portucalensis]MCX9003621.1 restriction endonuclease subunit S [Citrobacter portucalensis]